MGAATCNNYFHDGKVPELVLFVCVCDTSEHKVLILQNGVLLCVISHLKTILKVTDLIRKRAVIGAYSIADKDRGLDISSFLGSEKLLPESVTFSP